MARPYSQDLRERAIAAVKGGQSRNAVARAFGLSPSCVVKWMQRYHATGSVEAKAMGGRRPYALSLHRIFVLRRLAEKPDLTISALEAELVERGITRYSLPVSRRTQNSPFQTPRVRFPRKRSFSVARK